jgi:hypothetical protein
MADGLLPSGRGRALRLIDQLRDGINKLKNISGLGHVALGSGAQASFAVGFVGRRRVEENRREGIETANMAAHLDARPVGEEAAQQVKVKAFTTDEAQAVGDGLGRLDLIVGLPEQEAEQVSGVVVVFGAEDAAFSCLHAKSGSKAAPSAGAGFK